MRIGTVLRDWWTPILWVAFTAFCGASAVRGCIKDDACGAAGGTFVSGKCLDVREVKP